MVINGLKPFIPVKLVGTTTYGKNVGSITLYDSPSTNFLDKSSANPTHVHALQPIVFQIFNKNGESDYTQGFPPNIEVKEYQYWNSILPFGDENEVVLKAALDDIRNASTKSSSVKTQIKLNTIKLKTPERPFDKEMYINNDLSFD